MSARALHVHVITVFDVVFLTLNKSKKEGKNTCACTSSGSVLKFYFREKYMPPSFLFGFVCMFGLFIYFLLPLSLLTLFFQRCT